MQKLNQKHAKMLTLLCAVSYFVSYLTRTNFAAIITAIIQTGIIEKTAAGMVTTIGFITYGVGQLISGWLGDRINPKKLMFVGFITTAAMNFIIPFCPNGYAMCLVWGVNGFAQSLMWPPMVKIMSTAMDTDTYNKSCVSVTLGSTLATVSIYILAPVIISLTDWKGVFYITSVSAMIMSGVWYVMITKIEKISGLTYVLRTGEKKKKKKNYSICGMLLAVTMVAICLQGSLRDGVTTWVPTYISEEFKLGSEISILSGVGIPIFSLVSIKVVSVFYNKMGKKPFKCTIILFAVAAACCGALTALSGVSVILTIILTGLIVACMHGINLILVCYLPAIYADADSVSSLSGTLNFMTYVGSALSTYGFALLSEKFGWGGTIISWLGISVFGAIMCFVANIKSKKD
ncbi:MAG: MFS transporter [Clostridia bacterium]|nr:MFS transporter [Clostridia bacterium]